MRTLVEFVTSEVLTRHIFNKICSRCTLKLAAMRLSKAFSYALICVFQLYLQGKRLDYSFPNQLNTRVLPTNSVRSQSYVTSVPYLVNKTNSNLSVSYLAINRQVYVVMHGSLSMKQFDFLAF